MKVCGIYCFEVIGGNLDKIGWMYIGESKTCFNRKRQHLYELKRNNHVGRELQHYYNKYGEKSLKFKILILCNEQELDFWEKWFIKSFDSIKNGFNTLEGGNKPPCNIEKQSKKCTMENIKTGEVVTLPSYSEFARVYNLPESMLSMCMRGIRYNRVGDWFCPTNKWRPKRYQILSPNGQLYEVTNMCKFCKEHGIKHVRNLHSVLTGKTYSTQGWKRPNSSKKPTSHPIYKNFKIKSPTGEIIECETIPIAAKKMGLNLSSLRLLLIGEYKQYKGWTLA